MKDKIKKFFSQDSNKNSEEQKEINLLQETSTSYKNRRSIRKFSSEPIDEKVIYDIIDTSLNTPCAGNIQNYSVIVVRDEQKKIDIGKIAFQQSWIAEAPIVLIVTSDSKDVENLYPLDGKKYSIQNTAAFISSLITFSHFAGLASCWVGAHENDVLKDHLSVPDGKTIEAIIPIGYPLEKPKEVSKSPTTKKIFFDKYGNSKK